MIQFKFAVKLANKSVKAVALAKFRRFISCKSANQLNQLKLIGQLSPRPQCTHYQYPVGQLVFNKVFGYKGIVLDVSAAKLFDKDELRRCANSDSTSNSTSNSTADASAGGAAKSSIERIEGLPVFYYLVLMDSNDALRLKNLASGLTILPAQVNPPSASPPPNSPAAPAHSPPANSLPFSSLPFSSNSINFVSGMDFCSHEDLIPFEHLPDDVIDATPHSPLSPPSPSQPLSSSSSSPAAPFQSHSPLFSLSPSSSSSSSLCNPIDHTLLSRFFRIEQTYSSSLSSSTSSSSSSSSSEQDGIAQSSSASSSSPPPPPQRHEFSLKPTHDLHSWIAQNSPAVKVTVVYSEASSGVKVTAIPFFLGCLGAPQNRATRFWRYLIRMENLTKDRVVLRERSWKIFSVSGSLETVKGRGVVGLQPVLDPETTPVFQYHSHTQLSDFWGHMWGSYRFERLPSLAESQAGGGGGGGGGGRERDDVFDVRIPAFPLCDTNLLLSNTTESEVSTGTSPAKTKETSAAKETRETRAERDGAGEDDENDNNDDSSGGKPPRSDNH